MNTATTTIDITQAFRGALQATIGPVTASLSELLNVPVTMDSDAGSPRVLSDVFAEADGGMVCCRSMFTRTDAGIGGILLGRDTAVVASCSAMMAEPEELLASYEFDGLVEEAMVEIWNNYLEVWNRECDPDYRMSPKLEERSVEDYDSGSPFPEAAGAYHYVFEMPLQVGEHASTIVLLLPLRAIQGRDLLPFQTPDRFVAKVSCASKGAGSAAGTVSASPAQNAKPTGNPVVFFDYTGEILKFLQRQATNSSVQCVVTESLDDSCLPGDGDYPAGTVIVGIDPEQLKEFRGCSCVEIRPTQ
ncbi:MAG: hypothetical protein AAF581_19690 [Planctomycetota bacterium]